MKIKCLIIALFPFTILFAQKPQPSPTIDKINPEVKTYRIIKNSLVKIKQYDKIYFDYNIIKGNRLVFDYNFKSAERTTVADDELNERIVFEIAPNAKEFTLCDSNFAKAKALFTRSCFCTDRGNYKINGGSIVGKKISAMLWKVDMDLTITQIPELGGNEIKIKVSGVYKMPIAKK